MLHFRVVCFSAFFCCFCFLFILKIFHQHKKNNEKLKEEHTLLMLLLCRCVIFSPFFILSRMLLLLVFRSYLLSCHFELSRDTCRMGSVVVLMDFNTIFLTFFRSNFIYTRINRCTLHIVTTTFNVVSLRLYMYFNTAVFLLNRYPLGFFQFFPRELKANVKMLLPIYKAHTHRLKSISCLFIAHWVACTAQLKATSNLSMFCVDETKNKLQIEPRRGRKTTQ